MLAQGTSRRDELNHGYRRRFRPMFGSSGLTITEDILFRLRFSWSRAAKAGHTYSQPDLIIAATALHYGLPS